MICYFFSIRLVALSRYATLLGATTCAPSLRRTRAVRRGGTVLTPLEMSRSLKPAEVHECVRMARGRPHLPVDGSTRCLFACQLCRLVYAEERQLYLHGVRDHFAEIFVHKECLPKPTDMRMLLAFDRDVPAERAAIAEGIDVLPLHFLMLVQTKVFICQLTPTHPIYVVGSQYA